MLDLLPRRPIVLFTDPPWALDANGRVDSARAKIEHEILSGVAEIRFGPTVRGRYVLSGLPLEDAVCGVDALVISRCLITETLLAAAGPLLRVVCRLGVGVDNLAPELLAAHGIAGFNVPDYCVDEVAAHTVALLLALERGVVPQHNTLAGGRFDIYAGGVPRRLHNCTAGIVGFGRIGQAVSHRLRTLYGRIAAYDPYVSTDFMAAHGVQKVDLRRLLANADVVTLHCALTDETRRLIDAAALAMMKPTTFLVNAARGALVDAGALWHALDSGRIGGAALDVFSPEDPHADEWSARVVRHPNVVVSSHRAYLSGESEASQRRRAAEGVLAALLNPRAPLRGTLAPVASAS